MKVYTIKDKEGNLYPKAILELENKNKGLRDGKIVTIDYGLETVQEYLESKKGKDFDLAICELSEVENEL